MKSVVHKTTKPDIDKLTRALHDALTGIAFEDDSQIIESKSCEVFGDPDHVSRFCTLTKSPVNGGNMQPEPIDLNIGNICEGAVPELFLREVINVLQNIADVNTPADAKRKISMEWVFLPTPDRKSAVVSVTCTSKIAGVEAKAGTIYFRQSPITKGIEAYAEDPRQDILFARSCTSRISRLSHW
jgi:hypothetical protein